MIMRDFNLLKYQIIFFTFNSRLSTCNHDLFDLAKESLDDFTSESKSKFKPKMNYKFQYIQFR